jgi:hypothetical protein
MMMKSFIVKHPTSSSKSSMLTFPHFVPHFDRAHWTLPFVLEHQAVHRAQRPFLSWTDAGPALSFAQVNAKVNKLQEMVRTLLREVGAGQAKDEVIQIQLQALRSQIASCVDRLDKLHKSTKYRDSFSRALMLQCGGQTYKPQRVSVLSWEEEKARCKATWHHFDETLQLAAFGSFEELRRRVSNPESWIANRKRVQY